MWPKFYWLAIQNATSAKVFRKICPKSEFLDAIENSKKNYGEAQAIAVSKLDPVNVTRLGLGLNFSVFYYDIAGDKDTAISMAAQVGRF